MDHLPPINKVFALISQEEKQRSVVRRLTDYVSFNVKYEVNKSSQKKDRSICTHCGYHGHTIEKCYKLHSYPSGYKVKQKFTNQNNTSNANQVNVAIMGQDAENYSSS